MDLKTAIKKAADRAFEKRADQVVGQITMGKWCIAHIEDRDSIDRMFKPKFKVHSYGVDPLHIYRKEITVSWRLP